MKVMILCGGQGTRLREETEFRPKPLVEVGGRPILLHIMKSYAHHGFNDFVLCLGYRGNMIKEHFLNYEAMNNDFTVSLGSKRVIEYHGAHDEGGFSVTLADTGLDSMTGKRDPFLSPVVNRQGGSGCSTGKKCLDIEQIALHGVIKSDAGMIAVVTNSLNKAYFLRENDPVFNGYVVKITVDSIVFKQTVQDRLGKPFTKDVVKRILTPAV